jgi:broad specificity phosphatase PhoE
MTNSARSVVHWVRHGENLANVSGQFSNRKIDFDLTEKGAAQATQVAEFLAQENLGSGPVFASPMRRAVQTGEIIAGRLGRSVEILEDLREVDLGDLEGRSDADAVDLYWDVLTSWRQGDRARTFPGGENHLSMAARIQAALNHVRRETSGGPSVIAAHAGLLRAGFTHLLDIPFLMKISIPNCSVSRLTISDQGRFHFDYVARCDFLTQATDGKGA